MPFVGIPTLGEGFGFFAMSGVEPPAPPDPNRPFISSALTHSSERGQPFLYQITATTTGSPITSYGASGLPAGLSVNTTNGEITGTPTTAVTGQRVTIRATNAEGTGSARLLVDITVPGTGPGPGPTPTPPWASDLTFSFPGLLQTTPPPPVGGSPFNFGTNGKIALTRLGGWDPAYAVDFTDANLYPPGGHTAANVPIKLFATYAGQPELQIDFDYTSDVTPVPGVNKVTMWGYSSADSSIYIDGSNGTGAPIALRLEKP